MNEVYQQGFPVRVDKWRGGVNLSKMAKKCMKITKSTFVAQNSEGGTVVGVVRVLSGDLPQSHPHFPPLGETLINMTHDL